ncbi:hypothetical protein BCV69DRAFT_283540 [Microstroma glucosiphilum]|uniref:Uncharacterized protein n=1 Tax=Pseudomicrostroma glucosiphilum TaxID=1684307 RepID=A0A316U5A8_9BASI|nr:hypothetical protein BCV69DRAFT_283540 [Pseudomicrostroma glucosiphilum]PWN20018.1 hypothetical protein BCV69DRAFT_283540 [Pseudomicrostroma glucosiphilum]
MRLILFNPLSSPSTTTRAAQGRMAWTVSGARGQEPYSHSRAKNKGPGLLAQTIGGSRKARHPRRLGSSLSPCLLYRHNSQTTPIYQDLTPSANKCHS